MNGNVNLLTHLAWLTGLWHKARVSSMMIILFQFFLSSEFPFPTPNHFDDELRIPIWDMSLSRLAEISRLWLFISIGLLLPTDKRWEPCHTALVKPIKLINYEDSCDTKPFRSMYIFLYPPSSLLVATSCTDCFSSIAFGFASLDVDYKSNLLYSLKPLEGSELPLWFPTPIQYTQRNQDVWSGSPLKG